LRQAYDPDLGSDSMNTALQQANAQGRLIFNSSRYLFHGVFARSPRAGHDRLHPGQAGAGHPRRGRRAAADAVTRRHAPFPSCPNSVGDRWGRRDHLVEPSAERLVRCADRPGRIHRHGRRLQPDETSAAHTQHGTTVGFDVPSARISSQLRWSPSFP
jgi:hypothetical protein